MLRIALLGAWHVHSQEYAEEASKTAGVRITAVWDDDPHRGMAYAKAWGVDFESDLQVLLKREDVDAVIITCATCLHKDVLLECAKAKKHIYTEKVLTASWEDAKEVAQAIKDAHIKFCISLPFKSYPYNQYAKYLVENHILGQITGLRIRDAHDGASAGWLPDHFYDKKECQGGAMLDLGAHPMYLSAWLLGTPVSIVSLFSHVYGREVEDNASCVIEFENHVLASSETSLVASRADMVFELYGTKGWFKYSGRPSRVKDIRLYVKDFPGCEEEGCWTVPELPSRRPTPIQQWIHAIEENLEIMDLSLEDAMLLTKLMDGAYRADQEERKVYFSEFSD